MGENMMVKSTAALSMVVEGFFYVVALMFSLLIILYASGILPPMLFEMIVICIFLSFIIGYGPEIYKSFNDRKYLLLFLNGLCFLFGVASCIYILPEVPRIRETYGSLPPTGDIVFGSMLLISLMELTRKRFGIALPVLFIIFLLYALFGNLIPEEYFGHRGFSYARIISYIMGPTGVFGFIMSIFVRIIALFLIFGAFIEISGMGKYMIDFALSVAGRWRGGPAKVAILASAIIGSIQGTSVTNVATTGAITIPLMKKVGYSPSFAGAVEASASVGGLLLPPIMGASAFLMAEFIGIPYREVIKAAFIPAILYFIGVFLMVDLEAIKHNLRGVTDHHIPIKQLKKGLIYFVPIFLLLYLIMAGVTINRAALIGILSIFMVSWFSKENRMGFKKVSNALVQGAKVSIGIASICALAGALIVTLNMTGVGLRFSSILINLVGENVFLIGIIVALLGLVLGMGLPATAGYIIVMAIAAPTLVRLGVPVLAAHLFVYYFAMNNSITPPIGVTYYTAAAIANAPPHETGFKALLLAIGAYTIPFFFILDPVLLMMGEPLEIIQAFLTGILGMGAISMCIVGRTFISYEKASILQRVMFLAAFTLLLYSGMNSDFYGLIILVIGLTWPNLKSVIVKAMG